MTTTAPIRAKDVAVSPDRLRDALSVWPSTVEDDVREELMTPCPLAGPAADQRDEQPR